jgi:hypothetical protein
MASELDARLGENARDAVARASKRSAARLRDLH